MKKLLLTFFIIYIAFCESNISLENFNQKYKSKEIKQLLYIGRSIIDKSEIAKNIMVVYSGDYYLPKVLICNEKEIEKSINLKITPGYSKFISINYKDILQVGYNQIILEMMSPIFGRGETEQKHLIIIAQIKNEYKQIFDYIYEDKIKDNIENWEKHIKWEYFFINKNNLIIKLKNKENKYIDKFRTNNNIQSDIEYIWNGQEFKVKQ